MPRIYKSLKPSANKAATPVKETKSEGKSSETETQKSNDKKNGGQ